MNTIERTIISALIRDMRAAGFQPAAVWDGEAYVMANGTFEQNSMRFHSSQSPDTDAPDNIERAMTDVEALAAIDSVDDSTLHFTHQNATTWGNRGVLLILGNGEDVISDYHCGDTAFSAVVDGIYSRLNAGAVL